MISRDAMGSGVRRLVGNAASLLTSDVLNRATTFILYALVARYLGTFVFGQMSLALTFFYTFQVFAVAGLSTLITRDITKDRTKTDQYLVHGSMIVVASSLGSLSIQLGCVWLLHYSTETSFAILLLSLGLIPYALAAVCEAVFQAWERMHYIAYANVPANIAKMGLAFLILSQGYGLHHMLVLLLGSLMAIVAIEWGLMLRYITRPRVRIDLRLARSMMKTAVTFLGIDSLIAVWAGLNIVLLSKLASETELGLYSAVTQALVPVNLIYQSIVVSVFPMMCRHFDASVRRLQRIGEQVIELLLAIALPSAIGLFFLADAVLVRFYGERDFLLAAGALRIMVWNLIFLSLTHALGQVLLARSSPGRIGRGLSRSTG